MADTRTTAAPKSCDVLAGRLRRQILRGRYLPGQTLPTERELAVATQLSRGSIREALRTLEAQGLVQTLAGRHGGSIVSRPTDDQLGIHIDLFARAHGVSIRGLVDARAAIEPTVAQLAAVNRTEDDLAALRQVARRLDDAAEANVARFLRENVKWHLALAAASHNDLLRAFAASISKLAYDASRLRNFATADVRAVVSRSHRRILQAIEAGDAEAARRRTERDIAAYAKHLQALLGPVAGA